MDGIDFTGILVAGLVAGVLAGVIIGGGIYYLLAA
jgi:hypothetical protein